MNCKNCGIELPNGTKFCANCGAPVIEENTFVQPAPMPVQKPVFTEQMLPEQYRPLSAWAYFGLSLLYSIPIVGFIFLIIFSFNSSNINRRSFTRSYWCALLLAAIVFVIVLIISAATGAYLLDF